MNNLAADLADQGRFAEAEKTQREMLEIERRVLGPEHPETLASTGNLANYLANQAKFGEAEKIYRETYASQQRILPDHLETLRTLGNLANLLADRGEYAEAEKLKRTVMEKYRHTYGSNFPETTAAEYDLACLLARQGRSTEAIAYLRQALNDGISAKIGVDMAADRDLKPLHGDPRFEAIVSTAQEQAKLKMQNKQ
jgi:tetratricopeptide (TPR) repeat protein